MDIYAILSSKPHNSHYLNRYIKFINGCRQVNLTRQLDVTFKHHICPKANDMFPQYKSFAVNPWNRIDLTARQHFIAHVMLFKIFRNQSCAFAISNFGMKNSRNYAKRILEHAVNHHFHPFLGTQRSEITKNKISNTLMGVPLSDERKHNMSIAKKKWHQTNEHAFLGQHHTEATKEEISNSVKKYYESDLSIEHREKLRNYFTVLNKSPEKIQQIRDIRSKHYIATSPDNIEYEIFNLSEFCRQHNLDNNHMSSVANGRRKHHKGWLCRHRNDGESSDSSPSLTP